MISSTRALLHLHNSLNKVFKGNTHQLMPCVWITPLPIPCLWTNKRRPLFFAQISHSGWLLAGHSQHKCFLLTLLTTANSPLAPSWKPCWLPGKEKVKSSSVIYCLASFVVSIFTLFVCCFVFFLSLALSSFSPDTSSTATDPGYPGKLEQAGYRYLICLTIDIDNTWNIFHIQVNRDETKPATTMGRTSASQAWSQKTLPLHEVQTAL